MMVFLILNLDIERQQTEVDKGFPLSYFILLSNEKNLKELKIVYNRNIYPPPFLITPIVDDDLASQMHIVGQITNYK
jgi:hypothetical protein